MVIATSLRAEESLLARVDDLAKGAGLSRNAWVVRALEAATGVAERRVDLGDVVDDHEVRIGRLEEVAGL